MRRLLGLLLLTVATPALAQTAPAADEAALRAHVAFLADDAMKGREPGTPEFDIAANYVATRMSAAGLAPAGDADGAGASWFQKVALVAWQPLTKGTMAFTRAGKRTDLVWGEDFLTRANPLAPDFRVEGDMVFVGYGVVDPASGRDDYKGLDVRGKVAVVLYGGPAGMQSEIRAHHGDRDTKAAIAVARGATAVLFVESTMLSSVFPFARIAEGWQQTGMTWADAQGRAHGNGAPTIGYLSQAGAAKVFAGSRIDWAKTLAADAAGGKVSTGLLGATLSSRQDARVWQLASKNVVGRLEGSDPALQAETVVLSAHLDHVGVGNPVNGDAIYNGAIDNAAGTAAMLEVARAFQVSGKRPRRSLLFVAVTAEEKGLIGSEYFALNPTASAGRLVANVNLDMPILTYRFEDLVAYGADRTSIGPVVGEVAKANGLTLTPDPAPEQASFVRSDHYSFVKAGVPAVSLEPGPKGPGKAATDDFLAHHYHQPSDDLTRPIDWASGVRFVQINYAIARALADSEARPSWNKGDFFGKLYKGYGAD